MLKINLIFAIFTLSSILCLGQVDISNTSPSTNYTAVELESTGTFDGKKSKGKYSIYFGCDNQATEVLDKPFIFIEGIDFQYPLFNEVEGDNIYSWLNDDFLYELRKDGFDIITLDFNHNPDYIQANAELLITLINEVNSTLQANGSKHEIVIMGESMGSMVSRYALTKMENSSPTDHNVGLWVSFDGPNNGANIPWGLQYMARTGADLTTLAALLVGPVPAFFVQYFKYSASGREAGAQLLYDTPFGAYESFRTDFENDLQGIGDYPQECRKVALANGSCTGERQPDIPYDGYLLQSFTIGIRTFKAYAASGTNQNGVDDVIYHSKTLGIAEVFRQFTGDREDVDGGPGGNFYFGSDEDVDYSFIPTISAFDINTNDVYFDFSPYTNWDPDPNEFIFYTHSSALSPFDALHCDSDNSGHATLHSAELMDNILNEISPAHKYVQNRTLNKDIIFEARDYVTLGKNETPSIAIGEVVFENNSDSDIKAGKEIYLKNGFHAKAGSDVKFYIEEYECN